MWKSILAEASAWRLDRVDGSNAHGPRTSSRLIPVDSPPRRSYRCPSAIDRPRVHELKCRRKGMEFPMTACQEEDSRGRWLMGVGALAISIITMNTTRPADATGLFG